MSDSLWPHGLQRARPPCPSPTPSSWLKLMSIESDSSSAAPSSSCLQSFPASGSFPVSQFFASSDQSIGALSFRAQVNLKNGSVYFLESGFPSLHPTGTFLNESFTDFLPATFHTEMESEAKTCISKRWGGFPSGTNFKNGILGNSEATGEAENVQKQHFIMAHEPLGKPPNRYSTLQYGVIVHGTESSFSNMGW